MTTPVANRDRRAPRARPVTIDFTARINDALAAFASDVSYAVAMARAAVVIDRKRQVWAAREELRAAEAAARTECANTEPFDCHAVSACGTGDCKFAHGQHAALTVTAAPGTSIRPQARSAGHYRLDDAVAALADRRTVSR